MQILSISTFFILWMTNKSLLTLRQSSTKKMNHREFQLQNSLWKQISNDLVLMSMCCLFSLWNFTWSTNLMRVKIFAVLCPSIISHNFDISNIILQALFQPKNMISRRRCNFYDFHFHSKNLKDMKNAFVILETLKTHTHLINHCVRSFTYVLSTFFSIHFHLWTMKWRR